MAWEHLYVADVPQADPSGSPRGLMIPVCSLLSQLWVDALEL
jgi:hypothetical protein